MFFDDDDFETFAESELGVHCSVGIAFYKPPNPFDDTLWMLVLSTLRYEDGDANVYELGPKRDSPMGAVRVRRYIGRPWEAVQAHTFVGIIHVATVSFAPDTLDEQVMRDGHAAPFRRQDDIAWGSAMWVLRTLEQFAFSGVLHLPFMNPSEAYQEITAQAGDLAMLRDKGGFPMLDLAHPDETKHKDPRTKAARPGWLRITRCLEPDTASSGVDTEDAVRLNRIKG